MKKVICLLLILSGTLMGCRGFMRKSPEVKALGPGAGGAEIQDERQSNQLKELEDE